MNQFFVCSLVSSLDSLLLEPESLWSVIRVNLSSEQDVQEPLLTGLEKPGLINLRAQQQGKERAPPSLSHSRTRNHGLTDAVISQSSSLMTYYLESFPKGKKKKKKEGGNEGKKKGGRNGERELI